MKDEAALPVVAVDGTHEADAAIVMTTGVEEAAVTRQANWTQVAARVAEADAGDVVRHNSVEEAASFVGTYGPLHPQELARGETLGAARAAVTDCLDEARALLLEPGEVDRRLATESCLSGDPSACDDKSVSARVERQEGARKNVARAGRALKRSQVGASCLSDESHIAEPRPIRDNRVVPRPTRDGPMAAPASRQHKDRRDNSRHAQALHVVPRYVATNESVTNRMGHCSGMTPERALP